MFAMSLTLVALAQLEAPTELTLANGMKWVLVQRPDRGIVGGVVVVRAGGADETERHTGVAHMLEHLAFKGTPIIGSPRGWRVEEPFQRAVFELEDRLAQLEATGGLTIERVREYAETGVDYLSVGALTHSSPILDIALDLRAR